MCVSTSLGVKRGRPSKPFEECCQRTKLRRTEELRCDTDPQIVFYSVVKILQAQGFHTAAKSIYDICSDPSAFEARHNSETSDQMWSKKEALGVFVEVGLSRRNWQSLRTAAVQRESVLVPPYTAILEAKEECYPEGMIFSDTSGEVPLQCLLDQTIQSILNIETVSCENLNDVQLNSLQFLFKYGMDESSGHSTYRQQFQEGSAQVGSDTHVFISTMVSLQISVAGETTVLWENPTPNSSNFCRMMSFKFVKESACVITETYKNISDQISCLRPSPAVLCGRSVMVSHKPLLTMVDVKVINILCKVGSKTCYLCGALPSEVNNLEVSKRSIFLDRLQYGASPLHCKLRCMDALINIAKKLDVQQHVVSGDLEKQVVLARHHLIQEGFRTKMNLLVDFPLPGGSGNSNNGNTARRVFDSPALSASILGIDEQLITQLAQLNHMLASNQFVDPNEFETLAKNTAQLYVRLYSWYPMSPTLHKILMHGADIIRALPVPVGRLSEEPQETSNKDHRDGRLNFAFKCSRSRTNEDVLKRNMVTSDPYYSTLRAKK